MSHSNLARQEVVTQRGPASEVIHLEPLTPPALTATFLQASPQLLHDPSHLGSHHQHFTRLTQVDTVLITRWNIHRSKVEIQLWTRQVKILLATWVEKTLDCVSWPLLFPPPKKKMVDLIKLKLWVAKGLSQPMCRFRSHFNPLVDQSHGFVSKADPVYSFNH